MLTMMLQMPINTKGAEGSMASNIRPSIYEQINIPKAPERLNTPTTAPRLI